jgi:hypothetical protein
MQNSGIICFVLRYCLQYTFQQHCQKIIFLKHTKYSKEELTLQAQNTAMSNLMSFGLVLDPVITSIQTSILHT